MSAPLVSCVVPAFNGAPHLAEALDSILGQSYQPVELVVVDDGSTDRTPQIIASYGDRLRCVRQPNGGPAAARNLGVRSARGAFVAFLDQDDHWHPDKLARQVDRFAARPGLDVSLTHVESFWDVPRSPDQPRTGPVPGYVTGTVLARRAVFDRVGPFDAGLWFADSLDWVLRAVDQGVVLEMMPDVLLYHRVHAGNLSRRGRESRSECLRIVKRALDRRRSGPRG